MNRRARTAVLTTLACLAAAAIALLVWLPWNPFEGDAGPLDAWVPADSDAVVRFDAGALRRSDFLRELWDGPSGAKVREALGLDDLPAAVRDADASLASLAAPGVDPPTVAGDLLGREVLVAARGDDVLVMARISGRAKALDLLQRAGEERRTRWGVRFDAARDAYEFAGGDGARVEFARRRDVLLASTSRALLDAALRLAGGAGDPIVGRADYAGARPPVPQGARVAAWCDREWAKARIPKLPVVGGLLPDGTAPVRADVAIAGDAIRVTASYRCPARAGDRGAVASLAASAGAYAQAVGAFSSGAVSIDARAAFTAIFDAQPPARRRLLGSLAQERGTSVTAIVDALAQHVSDGVGFAVARLPETDRLKLDTADGDVVHPIPATLAVFRPRVADAEGFLRAVRLHAPELFGDEARLVDDEGPRGEPMLCVRGTRTLGPEWALLTPAFAVAQGEVVFSTNEACLRRALRDRGTPGAVRDGDLLQLDVSAEGFRRRLDDLRWETADRGTYHDWSAERRALRAERRARAETAAPGDAQRLEDEEIARRVRRRNEEEFPEAVAAYRRSIEWLRAFESLRVEVSGGAAGGEASVRCEIRAVPR